MTGSGLFSPFGPFPLPVRQRTKGSKKGERERKMDDKEVGPWPAMQNPQLGYHLAKGREHQHIIYTKRIFFYMCDA